jgi:hypothetical protein
MSRKNSKQASFHQATEYAASHNLRPGQYLYWQRRISHIIALHHESALQVLAETIPEAERVPISLLDLFAQPTADAETVLVASSLEALTRQIEERYASLAEPGAVLAHDLPSNFVMKAQLITRIVETIKRLISEEEQRAQARGEPFSQTQALRRALATCNGSQRAVQVNGQDKEHIIHVGLTTYYKYERLYTLYQGDEAQIAASFHRSTFRLSATPSFTSSTPASCSTTATRESQRRGCTDLLRTFSTRVRKAGGLTRTDVVLISQKMW